MPIKCYETIIIIKAYTLIIFFITLHVMANSEPSLKILKDLDDTSTRVHLLVDEIKRMQSIVDELHRKVSPVDPNISSINRVAETVSQAEKLLSDLNESKKKACNLQEIVREYSRKINQLECSYYYNLVRK